MNLSICMDSSRYLDEIIEELNAGGYRASYNTDMELLTIRGYNAGLVQKYGEAEGVYLTQRTRRTLRVVRKRSGE